MCAALGTYWLMRDRYAEAVDWIDRALNLPEADAHSAPRVRALCTKAWALWPLGRGAEQPAVMAEAETSARAMADPALLSQVLQVRAAHEASHGGDRDVAAALADEALRWAGVAGDRWRSAMAATSQAMAPDNAAELRRRVDRAASLLERSRKRVPPRRHARQRRVHRPVPRQRSGRARVRPPCDPARTGTRQSLPLDAAARQRCARRAAHRRHRRARAKHSARSSHSAASWSCGRSRLKAWPASPRPRPVHGDLDRAARLYGAAGSHRYGEPEDRVNARLHTSYFEPARTRHGADAWDNAVAEGAALSFEDAIAYALEETPA